MKDANLLHEIARTYSNAGVAIRDDRDWENFIRASVNDLIDREIIRTNRDADNFLVTACNGDVSPDLLDLLDGFKK